MKVRVMRNEAVALLPKASSAINVATAATCAHVGPRSTGSLFVSCSKVSCSKASCSNDGVAVSCTSLVKRRLPRPKRTRSRRGLNSTSALSLLLQPCSSGSLTSKLVEDGTDDDDKPLQFTSRCSSRPTESGSCCRPVSSTTAASSTMGERGGRDARALRSLSRSMLSICCGKGICRIPLVVEPLSISLLSLARARGSDQCPTRARAPTPRCRQRSGLV